MGAPTLRKGIQVVAGEDGSPSSTTTIEGLALVVVKRGPNTGSRFLLDRAVTSAGRHPSSDIFLDDVTAGRRHVEFRNENGEFWIVDLDSLNGTYLNGKLVESAKLAHGDEIQIGKFRLVFLTDPTRARQLYRAQPINYRTLNRISDVEPRPPGLGNGNLRAIVLRGTLDN